MPHTQAFLRFFYEYDEKLRKAWVEGYTNGLLLSFIIIAHVAHMCNDFLNNKGAPLNDVTNNVYSALQVRCPLERVNEQWLSKELD